MHALYIIGEPGIGKSTLVEAMTAGLPYEEATQPFAFRRYDCGVTELGRRRVGFSGTDALAMDVQPKVLQYLEAVRPRYVLGEGDRLANAGFFGRLRELGYQTDILYLFGAHLAYERRAARGSSQNPSWVQGRRTKADALAASHATQWLSAAGTPEELAANVVGAVADLLAARRLAVV
jgi:hypothetical protein